MNHEDPFSRWKNCFNDIIYSLFGNNEESSEFAANDNGANDLWKLSEETRHMNAIQKLMRNIQSRHNWNFFVGSTRFKTDFFLRFLKSTTEYQYEN